jgi:uncharacterized repeat protein (TIGR03803 family)
MPRTLFRGGGRLLGLLGMAALLLLLSRPAAAAETFNVVYNFAANPDGSAPVPGGALLQDALGNLYGELATGGGTDGNDAGQNYMVSSNGVTFNFLHTFDYPTAATDGAGPVAGLRNILFDVNATGFDFGVTEGGGTNGLGTVFLQNASGPFATIYAFAGGTDGANPEGRLLAVSGGYLGTTVSGGSLDEAGTVFWISTGGAEKVVHRFSGADGDNPWGGLQYGIDGNFYGTTLGGGTDSDGVVYRLSPSGTVSVIHNFTGGNDGSNPFGELATDFHGNFYGTASTGGAYGNGTIFRIDQWGHFKTLYSFPNNSSDVAVNGSFPNETLTLGIECSRMYYQPRASLQQLLRATVDGASGGRPPVVLYGTTSSGGADGYGVAFAFNTATNTYTNLWNFSGGSDGGTPNGKLLTSWNGNIYGVTETGGSTGNGTLFAIGGVLPKGSFPLSPSPTHLHRLP